MPAEDLDRLLERLVQKLADEGYLTTSGDQQDEKSAPESGPGNLNRKVKVEVTDKSIDFLGFKTLKDLLGSLGKSSFGAHDTRDLATGVEASGLSKQYEFGDTLNLDVSETLFSAIRRDGVQVPLNLEYSDLHVHQSEYQSSCATVLMLDCSHSMSRRPLIWVSMGIVICCSTSSPARPGHWVITCTQLLATSG